MIAMAGRGIPALHTSGGAPPAGRQHGVGRQGRAAAAVTSLPADLANTKEG